MVQARELADVQAISLSILKSIKGFQNSEESLARKCDTLC